MIGILIAILLAALVYWLCLVLGLPAIVAIIAAVLAAPPPPPECETRPRAGFRALTAAGPARPGRWPVSPSESRWPRASGRSGSPAGRAADP
jgi:hypothetical protein